METSRVIARDDQNGYIMQLAPDARPITKQEKMALIMVLLDAHTMDELCQRIQEAAA